MRCLTLAHALQQTGCRCVFVCRNLAGNMIPSIEQQGFQVLPLQACNPVHSRHANSAHTDWLECDPALDAEMTTSVMSTLPKPDWLVVDHYALDHTWETRLRPHCNKLLVIDDLADRRHDADMLLDQNYYNNIDKRYDGLAPDTCTLLLGPRHALLRDEFLQQASNIRTRKHINTILVFFGGVDATDETSKAIRAISSLQHSLTTHVIIGASNPHRSHIEQLCQTRPNVYCHYHVSNIADYMVEADIAIGGGGTTTWERCFLGLPAITITLAQNQLAVNQAVSQQGACVLVGDTSATEIAIAQQLDYLIRHPDAVESMSLAARSIMRPHTGAAGIASLMNPHHA